jgi:hypothetical protein
MNEGRISWQPLSVDGELHAFFWPLAEGQLSACHVGGQGQTGRQSNFRCF